MSNIISLYQVGGSIRDQFLGIQSKDIDYAVEADSYEAMRDYLLGKGYQIFLEKPEYLTIRAKCPNKSAGHCPVVDFTLCRTEEGYSDFRRPDSVQVGTILEDLSRRDFTVNAIAWDLQKNEYLDPYNGREDLEKMILRCVGSAEERMKEDALRALRAVRFMITKGFQADSELWEVLQSEWLPTLLLTLPSERIRQELQPTLAYDTQGTLDLLYQLPVEFRVAIFRELWLEPTVKKFKKSKIA